MKRSKLQLIATTLVALSGLSAIAPAVYAQDYDVVILDGRVMDPETLYDGVANVGITDGRIAIIADNNAGIDFAPGFMRAAAKQCAGE